MTILSIIILTAYIILIASFIYGFYQIPYFNLLELKPISRFTIIVPFRNEEENLPELLQSFSKLNYPNQQFEIIFVNDDSWDNGMDLVNQFKCKYSNISILLIDNNIKSKSPKKDAIETAINLSKFEWIVTTDADCIVPEKWLAAFDAFIQKNNPKMICAPVTFKPLAHFLAQYQLIDFASLMGATIGAFGIKKPFLCNGANLCYLKNSFIEVDGFEGNKSLSSGDDIFLLEKFHTRFPNKVQYLKSINSLVVSKPEKSIQSLISQRLRWASKTTKTQNNFTLIAGAIVFLMNALIIILLFSSLFNYFPSFVLLLIFSLKITIDFILIIKTLFLFNQKKALKAYPLSAIVYPFLSILILLGSSFKLKSTWKMRNVSS